ncbi:MAG: hypothetical protein KKH41_08370 [Candidatus Thermoplasmatota archaeon]|nr:hypothetical protein [Candidatus Thermoplasmatota archaeon]
MVSEILKSVKTALAFIGVTILVIVGLSALIAYGSKWPFNEAFSFSLSAAS